MTLLAVHQSKAYLRSVCRIMPTDSSSENWKIGLENCAVLDYYAASSGEFLTDVSG